MKKKTEFIWHPVDGILGAFSELLCAYFRMEVHGTANIPKQGPAIVIANHSGFSGADVVALVHLLRTRIRPDVSVLAHPLYFRTFGFVRDWAERQGLREASVEEGIKILSEGKLLLIFPEGERGNFKSSWKRYQLQKFHTGFVRLALRTGTPVIPCVLTGAEESHLSLGSVDLRKYVRGLRIPLPLNLVPLPSKWKVRFFDAIHYRRSSEADPTQTWILQQAEAARDELQHKLWKEKFDGQAAA